MLGIDYRISRIISDLCFGNIVRFCKRKRMRITFGECKNARLSNFYDYIFPCELSRIGRDKAGASSKWHSFTYKKKISYS